MPDLETSLRNQDLGYLLIVADLWNIDLKARDAKTALSHLVQQMRSSELVIETLNKLSAEARKALESIQQHRGRMNWSLFTRRYGMVREIGPARRDREQPYHHPISISEILWYRALIARAFFDTPAGPEEFVYIPDDLLDILPQPPDLQQSGLSNIPLGRPATPPERARQFLANDYILDHSCTILAALRKKIACPDVPIPQPFIKALLKSASILGTDDFPDPEKTREFLAASRAKALLQISQTWLQSTTINDLCMTPTIQVEGEPQNNPLDTRKFLITALRKIPPNKWWSLTGFIAAIEQLHPDFQRTAGDYDSWFIRDRATGEFLQGYQNWLKVEGALIKYIVRGPLHWLGILDLATKQNSIEKRETIINDNIFAFRLSPWATSLLDGHAPKGLAKETRPIHMRSDGQIGIPRLAPRTVRYQIARFCDFEGEKNEEYHYRFSPDSLQRAQEQGLKTEQLLRLLHHYAQTLPPNVIKAIKNWEGQGIAARIQKPTILRLSSPQLLNTLRSSRAARFLGDPLSPTAVIIKTGAETKILEILFELGYLGEKEFKEKE